MKKFSRLEVILLMILLLQVIQLAEKITEICLK